ncbi:MAG: hypothetical protein J3Q66DRAFT_353244 [Benniella sp.]|nr:MAG: hypothetical protein J3Q66DRAFT_353244 [Benniella sp.]
MSSTNDSKPTENENPFADSGNNEAPAASTAGATTLSAPVDEVARRPGSPQAPIENPFGDDLAAHVTSPTSVAATENTTATAAVTQPALTTVPASAPPTHVESTLAPTTPASEREAKLAILTEAFPTVEKEVCEFVLESHRGDVEASINALLEISDPDFQPEPQQPAPPVIAPPSSVPPTLPRRQDPDTLTQGVADMNLGSNQPRAEIDPILLASTSTSEQQLRADEDFARTLLAMDEYRARERQNLRNQQGQQQHPQQQQQQQQQPGEEGPSFTQELRELMDEELPKIKERFNVAADTTKKKVTGWYNQLKAQRAEAAARNQANQQQHQGQYQDAGSSQDEYRPNQQREPIRFGSRTEEDEPLARNRVTPPPPGSGANPPLPGRPYNTDSTQTPAATTTEPASNTPINRRTTVEDGNEL